MWLTSRAVAVRVSPCWAGATKVIWFLLRDSELVVAVARISKGAVGQRKDVAAVADAVTVEHGVTHIKGQDRTTGADGGDNNSKILACSITGCTLAWQSGQRGIGASWRAFVFLFFQMCAHIVTLSSLLICPKIGATVRYEFAYPLRRRLYGNCLRFRCRSIARNCL